MDVLSIRGKLNIDNTTTKKINSFQNCDIIYVHIDDSA